MIVRSSAPGKVVVSGEYAVLDGAPALVMAVNRRCHVTIEVTGEAWWFESRGFLGASTHAKGDLAHGRTLQATDPARIAQQILLAATFESLPAGLHITIDSTAAYDNGTKLGIGSSAAVCVALTAALAALSPSVDVLKTAAIAHRQFQGGRGSGLDVATAYRGGLVVFRDGEAADATWPEGVSCGFAFSGASADTVDQIARFESAGSQTREFTALKRAAEAVAGASAKHFVRELRRYARALAAFDAVAQLGIYSPAHVQIASLVKARSLVYKPCGAGGGDIGAAFSNKPDALASFVAGVTSAGFRTIDMELDQHGVLVDITG